MAGGDFAEWEVLADGFLVARVADAVAEGAAGGWVDGGWDVAFEEDFFAFDAWVGGGDGGEGGK